MRRSPTLVVFISLAVTLTRVAYFAEFASKEKWWSWAVSISIGLGLYVAGYYVSHSEKDKDGKIHRTFWYAILPALFLLFLDLLLNEGALIVSVSQTQLIKDGANFLGWGQTQIESFSQFVVLAVGAAPTLIALLFGALQGGVNTETKPDDLDEALEAIFTAVIKKVKLGIVRQTEWLLGLRETSSNSNGSSRKKVASVRWGDLNTEQRSELAGMSTAQIKVKYPGISEKTAYNWQQWAKGVK